MLSHFAVSKADRICWLLEGRVKKPKADGCWARARTRGLQLNRIQVAWLREGTVSMSVHGLVCMSPLIGEVEYIEGRAWEDGGQGSLCCGERNSCGKQHNQSHFCIFSWSPCVADRLQGKVGLQMPDLISL